MIVLGITLPTMHQSSQGSCCWIAPPSCIRSGTPAFCRLLFLINCMFIGYSIAILESVISSIRLQASLRDRATLRVGLDHPYLTTIWLCVVVGDLVWRGQVAKPCGLISIPPSSCWNSRWWPAVPPAAVLEETASIAALAVHYRSPDRAGRCHCTASTST